MKKDAFELIADENEDFLFKEAVDFLKNKVVLSYEEYKNIRTKYKALAFSVSGYTNLEILNMFYEEIMNAVKGGTTKEEFRKNMNSFLEKQGYTGVSRRRSDIIFRTNIQTAFNAGHYIGMTEEDVTKKRPYWRYRTAGDGRVRDAHREMDGKVYFYNDPIWDMWYPPNGFCCRCTVVSLSERQMIQKELDVESEPPYIISRETGKLELALPEKSFRNNPATAEWQPDLKSFPKVLKKAYKERMKQKP